MLERGDPSANDDEQFENYKVQLGVEKVESKGTRGRYSDARLESDMAGMQIGVPKIRTQGNRDTGSSISKGDMASSSASTQVAQHMKEMFRVRC